ncbi:predicted protein [Histoplasma mississippiense (nom. inval.)]|uniref:predicted protein n=1 Tax=Ajellomyces capsulatus (strain NAm1 / WU24) TaxID=2059318 RepID=UPI000157D3EA|nr:predicted protein [Histoplasma mississippiense (nom. inval.)]EDN04821.1 predicted protein [Histoplasma mississippiense (nom. inval.)]
MGGSEQRSCDLEGGCASSVSTARGQFRSRLQSPVLATALGLDFIILTLRSDRVAVILCNSAFETPQCQPCLHEPKDLGLLDNDEAHHYIVGKQSERPYRASKSSAGTDKWQNILESSFVTDQEGFHSRHRRIGSSKYHHRGPSNCFFGG